MLDASHNRIGGRLWPSTLSGGIAAWPSRRWSLSNGREAKLGTVRDEADDKILLCASLDDAVDLVREEKTRRHGERGCANAEGDNSLSWQRLTSAGDAYPSSMSGSRLELEMMVGVEVCEDCLSGIARLEPHMAGVDARGSKAPERLDWDGAMASRELAGAMARFGVRVLLKLWRLSGRISDLSMSPTGFRSRDTASENAISGRIEVAPKPDRGSNDC